MIIIKSRLYEALKGIFDYETETIDLGIPDRELEKEVLDYLCRLNEIDYNIEISTFIKETYLSEKALELSYGCQDARQFIDWVEEKVRNWKKRYDLGTWV